jgi:hypothetical protein
VVIGRCAAAGFLALACNGASATPPQRTTRAELNAECEHCHADIAREWRNSRHQRSASNDAFARAYALEADPFCWGCHAPEPEPASKELGTACVTCHLDEHGAVRSARADGPLTARHEVRRTDELRGSRACAGCHEFAFPGPLQDDRQMMQTTLSEHERSSDAAQSCSDCHMPVVSSHRSHAFASTRDPVALSRALSVVASRDGDRLLLRLTPRGVGHAFPTGDLFRRLRVVAEARRGERLVRREQRFLARHFEYRAQRGVSRRVEVSDDRPGTRSGDSGAVHVTFDFGAAPGLPLSFRVSYERVDHLRGDSEDEAVVGEAVLLAAGEIPP